MKYKIEWSYKRKGKSPVIFYSEWIASEEVIELGEEIEKSGKATDLFFYDEIGTSWTLKDMKKLTVEVEEEPHDITVYFDGGYNEATKLAGVGAVIYYKEGKKKYRIRANEKFSDIHSNNEAEYAAFYFAVHLLEELGVHNMVCEFKGDSQVVLKQLEGEWPCYEEEFNRWLDRIEAKLKSMGIESRYTSILRKDNKEADKLATQGLEGKMINSKMQII
ncbi:reverse transcriptase-like protein [Bacillus sp. CGMCC 1.16607]|uniref:reverse transcriptase-like protein n=1 Tax=Bacillus sp. CGMCC 1.16607 TaxID=3351842 RepID=UPI00363D9D3E